ncbi:MAG: DUF554 domain-containing protein [Treponema sp.]|nr:DUF554 domain-containing protein [Treponema sp.]
MLLHWTIFTGSAVNAAAIAGLALIGFFLIRGIPKAFSQRFDDIMRKAIGISIVYLGISGVLDNQNFLLLLLSMVIGGIIGELINIDGFMNRIGLLAEKKLKIGSGDQTFSKAFVSTSILFCSGSMAILGSLQSGLTGTHEILFAKAALDGTISLIFGASMGIGVAFSAIPVFIYQSLIALASMAASSLLTADIIREMAAVGSLIIAATGLNFLGLTEFKIANYIPAIFIPIAYLTFF